MHPAIKAKAYPKQATDHTGLKYGLLTAIAPDPVRVRHFIMWQCQCDCGNIVVVRGEGLTRGSIKSCGCLKDSHGCFGTPEYTAWSGMKSRCNDTNSTAYDNYGARGISVCERWDLFENFLADMGPRPAPQHSIDRINNSGNYEPENCRWVTMKEQSRNKRNNVMLTFRGETRCFAEWVEVLGISRGAAQYRLDKGWSVERAFTTPVKSKPARSI